MWLYYFFGNKSGKARTYPIKNLIKKLRFRTHYAICTNFRCGFKQQSGEYRIFALHGISSLDHSWLIITKCNILYINGHSACIAETKLVQIRDFTHILHFHIST